MLEASPHLLALAVLLSRLADLGSTYLVTPSLALEGNEFVRRFRWPYAVLTLAICFVPYLDLGLGVMVLVMSLLVSAANLRSAWLVRALGETRYLELLRDAAARSGRRAVFASVLASAVLVSLTGLLLLHFYPTPSWAWYFALGLLAYAGAMALHGSTFALRLFASRDRDPAVTTPSGLPGQ